MSKLDKFYLNFVQIKLGCLEFVKKNICIPSLLNLEFHSASYEFCKFHISIDISIINYLLQKK
jgi:hypothetical protein